MRLLDSTSFLRCLLALSISLMCSHPIDATCASTTKQDQSKRKRQRENTERERQGGVSAQHTDGVAAKAQRVEEGILPQRLGQMFRSSVRNVVSAQAKRLQQALVLWHVPYISTHVCKEDSGGLTSERRSQCNAALIANIVAAQRKPLEGHAAHGTCKVPRAVRSNLVATKAEPAQRAVGLEALRQVLCARCQDHVLPEREACERV